MGDECSLKSKADSSSERIVLVLYCYFLEGVYLTKGFILETKIKF